MGLFKFFNKNSQAEKHIYKTSINNQPFEIDLDKVDWDEFDKDEQQLEIKLAEIQEKNRELDRHFQRVYQARQSALQLEKEEKYNEALQVYLSSLIISESDELINILSYAFDIDRAIVLLSKSNQTERLIAFLEEKIEIHASFPDADKWRIRLAKLKAHKSVSSSFLPADIRIPQASHPTLGERYAVYKKSLPEFNFYFDLPPGADTLSYHLKIPFEVSEKLRYFRDEFTSMLNSAKFSEGEGDLKAAIEKYERLIVEDYEGPEPHERLILIYGKLKWAGQEKTSLERAIHYFENLKQSQLEYSLSLARKYNMEEKAFEYINQNKKIFYYMGVFELYNPQTDRLKKWHERLDKLNVKQDKT